MNPDSHKMIQYDSNFEAYSNPIITNAIDTYFQNFCSTYSVEDIALIEIAPNRPRSIISGCILSTPEQITTLTLDTLDDRSTSSADQSELEWPEFNLGG